MQIFLQRQDAKTAAIGRQRRLWNDGYAEPLADQRKSADPVSHLDPNLT